MDPNLWMVPNLLSMLGRELGDLKADPAFAQIFRHYREPVIDREAEQYSAWVTMKQFGLELGFVDRSFREAANPARWGVGPLVLNQVYFYREGAAAGIRAWRGVLPLGISFDDDRVSVRRKLTAWEYRRRSYLTDCWALDDHELVVAYTEGDAGVACVLCSIDDRPWPMRPAEVRLPSLREMLGCLGAASTSEKLQEVWRSPDVAHLLYGVTASADGVNLRRSRGFELRFAPASELDPAALSGDEMRLTSIHLFRERMHGAVAWAGELPFGLVWDDSPETLFRKVAAPPLDRREDPNAGTAAWELPGFGMLVSYSTTHNVLSRVIVQLPGLLHAAREQDL